MLFRFLDLGCVTKLSVNIDARCHNWRTLHCPTHSWPQQTADMWWYEQRASNWTRQRAMARTGPRCNREILLRQTSDWISAFDGFCDQSWWFIIDDVISPVRDSVLILNLLWEPNQIVWTEITVHYHYLEFSSSFSSDGENWIFIISLHHSSQDFHLIPS